MSLPKPCHDCPFRFYREGGFLMDDKGAKPQHGHPDREFQPCHNNTKIDCLGNQRNNILLSEGKDCGDIIRVTQTLTGVEYKPK